MVFLNRRMRRALMTALALIVASLAGAECILWATVDQLTSRAAAIRAAYPAAYRSELDMGILNVTRPPYNADPTGQIDSTTAIQTAVCDSRDSQVACFFPRGIYLISDQIRCCRPAVGVTTTSQNQNLGRNYPVVLIGSRQGPPPTIRLKPNLPSSAGFNSPADPKHILYIWAVKVQGGVDVTQEQTNISMEHRVEYLRFETGAGNSGAAGIYFRTAQGSVIEDLDVDAAGGWAGINGIAGSGGAIRNVTVTGGQYGIHAGHPNTSQPAPTLSGVTLTSQTVANLQYQGMGPLTLVGARLEGPGIQCALNWTAETYNAHIGVVDSQIELSGGAQAAIRTPRNVFLDNVYFKNAAKIVAFDSGRSRAGNPSGWAHAIEFADTDLPPTTAVRYLEGASTASDLARIDMASPAPPGDLQSRHMIPAASLASFNDPDTVNIRDFGAVGDGSHDDTDAIQQAIDTHAKVFVPKGDYRVSRPIVMRPDTQLFGIHHMYSRLLPDPAAAAFNNRNSPNPIVDSLDSSTATAMISKLWLYAEQDAEGAYALRWRFGRHSAVRDLKFRYETGAPANSRTFPHILITGQGGGRWYCMTSEDGAYTHEQAPSYRHILADGTNEPLFFYHLNGERASSEANVEFRNAQNIAVFSFKHEYEANAVRMVGCRNIRVYGHGGNGGGNMTPDQELYRIENCRDYLLANLAWQNNIPVPQTWNIISESLAGSGTDVAITGDKRVLYYKRGEPRGGSDAGAWPAY